MIIFRNSENIMYSVTVMLLFLINLILAGTEPAILKAKEIVDLRGLVEYIGALKIASALTMSGCMFDCLADARCVAFFYNSLTEGCVLHSKHFYFSFDPPSSSGNGWKYFKISDVSGGCPESAVFYRLSNFCYNVSETTTKDFSAIKSACVNSGGHHAAIQSKAMQNYFAHFLAGRPHNEVCLAGVAQTGGTWKLDDGTTLSFFNWLPNEPHPSAYNEGSCIVLKSKKSVLNAWFESECSTTGNSSCTYVCEYN